ncbi:hypothetical protein FOA43_001291 [Brettanomyces nanus]|uniref:Uncharacterized protein n=1 Tax=Eeniella nana TaxID=13502 RepID=A0A875S0W5_EENNA|nr:uncharacterized protein FOA43_001291 [Brettanomyces nanus]QPG73975.1 hypothetical protein FOA43_001291 [Brettanomyces nanus]
MSTVDLDLSKVLENLEHAAEECSLEQKTDVVSFCTILDVYLNDLSVYSDEQKYQLMDKLTEIFEGNHKLLHDVSWDLLPVFVSFLNADYNPSAGGLRQSPSIMKFMNLCELLALYGEPKELLLACCDRMESIKPRTAEDFKGSSEFPLNVINDDYFRRCVVEIHSLFEICSSCLRRNTTLRPSKFLGVAVTSLIKFLKTPSDPARYLVIVRRFYTFIRDYTPPDLPEKLPADFEESELPRLVADENYLQRKLLELLFSFVVEYMTKNLGGSLVALLVSGFPQEYVSRDAPRLEFIGRFVTLGLSMDLQFDELLQQQLEDAETLFAGTRKLQTSDDVFAAVIEGYNKDMKRDTRKLSMCPSSIVILYTYGVFVCKEQFSRSPLEVIPLIKLQLKLFVPFSIRPQLVHNAAVVCSMILTLEALEKDPQRSRSQLADPANELLLLTYLQNLSVLCMNSGNVVVVQFFYRFLVELLLNSTDKIAYGFLLDTIRNCPLHDLQARCVTILRDMMRREKVPAAGKDFNRTVDGLKSLSVDSTVAPFPSDVSEKPPLPPRSSKVIVFTPSRRKDITDLFDKALDETSVDPIHSSAKLLALISLVTAEKEHFDAVEVIKWLNATESLGRTHKKKAEKETDSKKAEELAALAKLLTLVAAKSKVNFLTEADIRT